MQILDRIDNLDEQQTSYLYATIAQTNAIFLSAIIIIEQEGIYAALATFTLLVMLLMLIATVINWQAYSKKAL